MTIEEKLNVILNKPADEWPLYMPYEGTIEEQVYETLTRNLIPVYRVPWVENIFVSGHPCFEAYFGYAQSIRTPSCTVACTGRRRGCRDHRGFFTGVWQNNRLGDVSIRQNI